MPGPLMLPRYYLCIEDIRTPLRNPRYPYDDTGTKLRPHSRILDWQQHGRIPACDSQLGHVRRPIDTRAENKPVMQHEHRLYGQGHMFRAIQ
jgi:hypothetical protein